MNLAGEIEKLLDRVKRMDADNLYKAGYVDAIEDIGALLGIKSTTAKTKAKGNIFHQIFGVD